MTYTFTHLGVTMPVTREQAETLIEASHGGSLIAAAKKRLGVPGAAVEITNGGLVEPSTIAVHAIAPYPLA